MDNLKETLEALIPKSIDDIIRANRDKASLAITSDAEIMAIHHEIMPAEPKDIMDCWSLITLKLLKNDSTLVLLLGNIRKNGEPRLTSTVIKIDLDRSLLITASGSLYELGTKLEGNPDSYQLIAVCAAFHSWGFGRFLGTPFFFY